MNGMDKAETAAETAAGTEMAPRSGGHRVVIEHALISGGVPDEVQWFGSSGCLLLSWGDRGYSVVDIALTAQQLSSMVDRIAREVPNEVLDDLVSVLDAEAGRRAEAKAAVNRA